MVRYRIREYGKNTKNFEELERDSLFFFLWEGSQKGPPEDKAIKAFGMLKPVDLYYGDNVVPILGIGNVMAVEKSRGYGTVLMDHIRRYLERNRAVGLGNSHQDNFPFYQKCGFQFIPGVVKRMVSLETDGSRRTPQDWSEYDLFLYDGDHRLDEIVKGSDEIIIRVPLW